ncbi:MAG: hypothetical protein V7603_5366 [Micromonosporaceae bacterium]
MNTGNHEDIGDQVNTGNHEDNGDQVNTRNHEDNGDQEDNGDLTAPSTSPPGTRRDPGI